MTYKRSYNWRKENENLYLDYSLILLSAIPLVGALINTALLIQRKRYAWLSIPFLVFSASYVCWQAPNIGKEREILSKEIEMKIEDELFNIRIPKDYSLEEEDIIPLVEEALETIVNIDPLKTQSIFGTDYYYPKIGKNYYKAIEEGIRRNKYPLLADNTYRISLYDLHRITEIPEFTKKYVEDIIPYSWLHILSILTLVLGGFLFFIINYLIFSDTILPEIDDSDLCPF